MILSAFCECPDKQRDGTPVYVASPNGEICFYLRRFGTDESSKKVKELKRALFGPISKRSDEDLNVFYAHWLCEYGVASWDDLVDDESGEKVAYSMDAARSLFLDERYFLSLNTHLINESLSYESYLRDDVEEATDSIKKL